jgi:hypothetical protein
MLIKELGDKSQYQLVVFLLVLTVIIFPKGGIKVFSIPITWGYILTFLFSAIAFLNMQVKTKYRLNRIRLFVLYSLIPLQLICILSLIFNGFTDSGLAISLLINITFLPFVYIGIFGVYLDNMKLSFLFKVIKVAILIVALYGIFLFFFKIIYGYFIEIPFLTVNYDDLGLISDKNIDRGDGIFKLISTYNNGNIYGVCMLMFLPLYSTIEKNPIKPLILKMSLIFTLSRTVWFGLIVHEFLFRAYVLKVSFKNLAYILVSVPIVVTCIFQMLNLFGANLDFLFDTTLGGRNVQIDFLNDLNIISYESFQSIGEVVYISIAKYFGILGLIFYIVGMTMPMCMHFLKISKASNSEEQFKIEKSIILGLLLYMCISISDGAFLLIPVMSFYWFLSSLLLSKSLSKI